MNVLTNLKESKNKRLDFTTQLNQDQDDLAILIECTPLGQDPCGSMLTDVDTNKVGKALYPNPR